VDAYERTLGWLYSLEKVKGIDLKLDRVAAALAVLGDPQRKLRCFHVAGTNGKGSVATYLASALGAAGYRVGMYTSPHLVELTERIQVDGQEIARDEVVALSDEIRRRVLESGIGLTYFEVLTAMAFLHFARAEVDYVALEVGLGGRLDATNLVDPVAAVITTVGIDHAEFLGSSLAEIAAEKAGIAKSGRPLVTGPLEDEAAQVIERIARAVGAPWYRAHSDFRWQVGAGGLLTFDGLGWALRDLEVGLDGAHQRDNAAVAVAALAAVRERVPMDEIALRRGLAGARWPGRLQAVSEHPRTIVDGAHNVQAMRALVAELGRAAEGTRRHVLFTAMGDKEWPQMIQILAPHCASAVVTEVLPERAAPVERMRDAFSAHCPASVERDPARAFAMVRAAAGADEVLVTGSLFLVGAILQLLRVGAQAGVHR
jgi:dihydrofolate synthase/folylpolyglutamate synthase